MNSQDIRHVKTFSYRYNRQSLPGLFIENGHKRLKRKALSTYFDEA